MVQKIEDITVIDSSNYDQLKHMLMSNDLGTVNVAMNIMEAADFEKSQIYILCLLKECDAINSDVRYARDFPKLEEKVRALDNRPRAYNQISFRYMLELVKKRSIPEEIAHFMRVYSTEFKLVMQEFGFTILEDIDIEFKLKEKNEQ